MREVEAGQNRRGRKSDKELERPIVPTQIAMGFRFLANELDQWESEPWTTYDECNLDDLNAICDRHVTDFKRLIEKTLNETTRTRKTP